MLTFDVEGTAIQRWRSIDEKTLWSSTRKQNEIMQVVDNLDDFLDDLEEEDRSELLRYAEKQSKTFARAFLEAVVALGATIVLERVIEAVQQGRTADLNEALALDRLPSAVGAAVERPLQQSVATGAQVGQSALEHAGVDPTLFVRFNLVNVHAVEFAKRFAGDLITNLRADGPDVLGVIKVIVADAVGPGGRTIFQLKQDLMPVVRMIGLTAPHGRAVTRYQSRLLAEGMAREQASRLVARYAEGLLYVRAGMIARTETIRALNAGQHAIWTDAVRNGLIDPRAATRTWTTALDERVCTDICLPMEGVQVGLQELFTLPNDDAVEYPPAHPQCRCRVVLNLEGRE